MSTPFRLPSRLRPAQTAIVARRVLAAAVVLGNVVMAMRFASADDAPPPPADPPAPAPAPAPAPPSSAAPKEPELKVAIGTAYVVRGLVPKASLAALKSVQGAVEGCYKEAVASEKEGEASVELRLELVGPGRVASATVSASVNASSTLRGCVRDAFAGVPAGGIGPEPAEILLPISFVRDVPDDAVRPASACPETCDGEITDDLKAALRDRAARAGHCFKRGPAPAEPATLKAGELDVQLRIAGDGSVCGIGVSNDFFGRPSLTSCVVEALSGTFTAAPDGCIDVRVPLVFKGT